MHQRPRTFLRLMTGSIGALLITTTACTSAGTIRSVGPTVRDVEWTSCRSDDIGNSPLAATLSERFQCATFAVPLDYDAPSPDIQIKMIRSKARGTSAERIGSLFLNPGGPGGSGIEFLATASIVLPSTILDKFDLVSFDPRGLGRSTPINCLTESERAAAESEPTPDDADAARKAADEFAKKLAEGCAADNDQLLHHMGTYEVVRDLDVMRRAVGDEKLNYLGVSYGTHIGGLYASTFPDSVRALVLDSPVTPSSDASKIALDQLKGFDASIQAWFADCTAKPSCPLAPDPNTTVTSVRASLHTQPVDVSVSGKSRTLTRDMLDEAITGAQYQPAVFDAVNAAVAAMAGTDVQRKELGARMIVRLYDQFSLKRPDGTFGNAREVLQIVNCADLTASMTDAALQSLIDATKDLHPILVDSAYDSAPACKYLPTGGTKGVITSSSAAAKIMVTASTGDPATPYPWAKEFTEALGVTQLTTYDGPGHGNLLTDQCLSDAATEFLVNLTPGPESCAKNPKATSFAHYLAQQIARSASQANPNSSITLRNATLTCLETGIAQLDLLKVATVDEPDDDPQLYNQLVRLGARCASER